MIKPRESEIEAHLMRLFSRCETDCPETTFQLDRSEVDGSVWKSYQFPTNAQGITNAIQWAIDWNKAGQNLYVGVNPRKSGLDPDKSATDADIDCSLFSFADLDNQASIDIARKGMPIENTFSVTTGTVPNRRVHLYWEHENPVKNLNAWQQTQVGIANYFEGDRVTDPRRIMRLAGTVNYPTKKKRDDRGYISEVVIMQTAFNGAERDRVDTVKMHTTYAATPSSKAPEKDPSTGGLNLPGSYSGADVQALIAKIDAGDNWHNNMAQLTAHWVARGWSDAEIRLSCLALTNPGYTHEDTVREVMAAVQGARQKWDYANPTYEVGPDSGGIPDTKPKPTKVITVTPFKDMVVQTHVNDFVEGLLGNAQMSVIYGESNSGKTFFVMDMAFHVAMGWPWRGLEVEQGAVIYAALEGQHGITNRCAALKIHYKAKIGDKEVLFGAITTQIDLLRDDGDTDALIEAIKAEASRLGIKEIKMIVIDTLARALSGGNENSSEDMGAIVMHGDRIRQATGAHVAFIHHSGKDKAMGARGHSSLRAATDTEIEVVPGEDASCASVVKQREYESGQEYTFSLLQVKVGTNTRGKEITSCVVEASDAPAPKQRNKRVGGKNQKTVLKALKHAVSAEGTPKLTGVDLPPLPYVTEDALRAAVYRKLSGDERHKASRFTEALDSLINDDHVNRDGERIWVC